MPAAVPLLPLGLGPPELFSVALVLVSGGFVYVVLRSRATLHSWYLMVGLGSSYLIFLAGAIYAVM